MTDPITAGKHFDDAVRSTSAFGELATKVSDTNDRVARMEPKLDKVVTTMDRYAGAMVVVGTLVSIAVSLIVAVIK